MMIATAAKNPTPSTTLNVVSWFIESTLSLLCRPVNPYNYCHGPLRRTAAHALDRGLVLDGPHGGVALVRTYVHPAHRESLQHSVVENRGDLVLVVQRAIVALRRAGVAAAVAADRAHRDVDRGHQLRN